MPPPRYAAGGPPGPGMGWDERPGHRAIVGFWVHKVRIHGLWRKEEKFNFIRSAL